MEIKRYQDSVQSKPAQTNLLGASQQRVNPIQADTRASSSMMNSLSSFFGEVGNIADEFGKQNAEIQGQQEAQDNHKVYLDNEATQKELTETLKSTNLTQDQRDLAVSNLAVAENQMKHYVQSTKKYPTINIAEMNRQATSAKLYQNDLMNNYTQMTEKTYEAFPDDPKGYAEATQKLTKKMMDTVPSDIIGSSMESFKKINSQVASKVHGNYKKKQDDIFVATNNKTIDGSLDAGTKFAYNGGDYSEQLKLIDSSFSLMYQKRLISKEEYSHKMDLVKKEFLTQKSTGNFDRIIGFNPDNKFLPNATQIKNGYQEIKNFEENKTSGFNQNEVTKMVTSMRSKLARGEAAVKKAQVASLKEYKTETSTAYKMMQKGIKPKNYNAIKQLASVNGQKDEFAYYDKAMTRVQTVNDMPLEDQIVYAQDLKKDKKTGMSELDYNIDTTIQKNINHKATLVKTDPSQLAQEDGMFTKVEPDKHPDIALKEIVKRKAIVKKGDFFAKYNTDPKSLISDDEARQYSHHFDVNPTSILPTIQKLEEQIGLKYTKPMLNQMFKKNASAVVFAADRYRTDPTSANMIIAGVEYQKNGGKLGTEDATTWEDDAPKFESTLMTFGPSGDAIRKAAKAYYMMMPEKDVTKAYAAVTNGIDGGIIVHKPGQSYDDTYGEITDLTHNYNKGPIRNGHRRTGPISNYLEPFKQKLNGEPLIGYYKVAEMINDDEVKLRTVGNGKYAFITSDTGSIITNTDNTPLVIDLNQEEE